MKIQPVAYLQPWKTPSNYCGDEYDDCYIVYSRTRDSDNLVNSNYDCILKRFKRCSTVFDVRHSHWLVGWIEFIMVKKHSKQVEKLDEIIGELKEDYPILDEQDYYNREYEDKINAWNSWVYKECAEKLLEVYPELGDVVFEIFEAEFNDLIIDKDELLNIIDEFELWEYDENCSRFCMYRIVGRTRQLLFDRLMTAVNPNWDNESVQLELAVS